MSSQFLIQLISEKKHFLIVEGRLPEYLVVNEQFYGFIEDAQLPFFEAKFERRPDLGENKGVILGMDVYMDKSIDSWRML